MLAVKRISEVNYSDYDEVWAIVRSLKNPNPDIKHVPELSPSWNLFKKKYRDLVQQGNWNTDTFQSVYVPQFLREMTSDAARRLLNQLYVDDKAGKEHLPSLLLYR